MAIYVYEVFVLLYDIRCNEAVSIAMQKYWILLFILKE